MGGALEIYNVSDADHLPIVMFVPNGMAAKWGERYAGPGEDKNGMSFCLCIMMGSM